VSLVLVLALPAAASRVRHNDAWARQQFSKAERIREALNGRPVGERTRREYQRVIDAYRRVYLGNPASSKADPSVVATAELMVEMGRRFNDDRILRGAVDEYRFLRKEYPGSKYRFDALFTIGEIYKDDLNDPQPARATFADFLRRYPRNRLAEDAEAAVKEIDDATAEAQRTARKPRRGSAKEAVAKDTTKEATKTYAYGPAKLPSGRESSGVSGDAPNPSAEAAIEAPAESSAETLKPDSASSSEQRRELPRVTGVRHWSTPDYTRVAIDVERDVKFTAERIAHPDRIYFDLKDTQLASTVVGKTFDVDDGFLKKIRVAEFKPGRTRIVLEVDNLSRYDAFLLPDPYRLIIDIHGKQSRAETLAKARRDRDNEAANGRVSSTVEAAPSSSASDSAASTVAEEDGNDAVAEKPVQRKSEKEHAIVAKVDNHDASAGDDEDDRADSQIGQLNGQSAVVKTTTTVKGTDRKIPKTIVAADEDEPPSPKSARAAKDRTSAASERGNSFAPAGSPSSGDAAPSSKGSTLVEADISPQGTIIPAPARTDPSHPSSNSTSASARRKKSHAQPPAADTADLEVREAQPTAVGDRSLTRALGLKIGKIVIDAGHGGHDTGTIGPNGLLEKDLVLDVALRLGRLLRTRMGAEVVYTRRDDTFIPLETRTAIANREQADLFISIHANSSHDPDARGVETYYLNFTSSPEALEVAARENAVSEKSIHELQDLVKKIALKEKIDESREFASDVQDSLYGGLALNNAGVRNRGVKKAPFIVLIGANMPSILAEISFVSNPTDERKLETSEQRQRIAEALYRGVSRYAGGLSGVKVASKIEKPAGQ